MSTKWILNCHHFGISSLLPVCMTQITSLVICIIVLVSLTSPVLI